MFKAVKKLDKEDFFGSSPPVIFIGSKLTYPNVNIGILSPPERVENAWLYDAQNYWTEHNYSIKEIMNFRSSLINSRFKGDVYDVRKKGNKFLDIAQEIGMASKNVDVEIGLKKKPNLRINFEQISLPMGPSAQLKKIRITSNPRIDTKVDKVVSDNDLKAIEGMNYLYRSGFDEHSLSQLLSIGVLGIRKNRKLVSTRSSITAVDDSLGKQLIKEIKDYKEIDDYRLYCGDYFGNYYYILMFPEIWGYELFEGYMPFSLWNPNKEIKFGTDYEGYYGRKYYAEECGGGYYASRFSVLGFLNKIRRQASVLVVRFETPEYFAPLGVFVVRSAAKKALENNSINFNDKDEMLKYTRDLIFRKFNYDIGSVFSKSFLLKNLKSQMKLSRFI